MGSLRARESKVMDIIDRDWVLEVDTRHGDSRKEDASPQGSRVSFRDGEVDEGNCVRFNSHRKTGRTLDGVRIAVSPVT